jgi:SAM-dependent methyltransferase
MSAKVGNVAFIASHCDVFDDVTTEDPSGRHEYCADGTDAVSRGTITSRTFRRILDRYNLSHKRVLDIGCGTGQYLVHFGIGSVGITTRPDEVEFGRKNDLDIRLGNAERLDSIGFEHGFDVFWANNLFEHLVSPHAFLVHLRQIASPGATLILGVPVVPKIASLLHLQKFRGALADSHIGFYTKKTLALTVERAGWEVAELRSFFLENSTLDRLLDGVSPHFYVVARSNSDFRYSLKKVKEWQGDEAYTDLLRAVGRV